MGGSIGMTIRDFNGVEHRMERWTNPLPTFINNMKLVDKCKEHIGNYLNTLSEPSSRPDTLAPSEYGQIVIDMVNNRILSLQSYTSVGRFSNSGVLNDSRYYGRECFFKPPPDEVPRYYPRHFLLREFFEDGRVSIVDNGVPLSVNLFNSNDLYDYILNCDHRKMIYFNLDMSPFKIIEYSDSVHGALCFKQDIIDSGFVLSDVENKLWDEWFLSRYDFSEDSAVEFS